VVPTSTRENIIGRAVGITTAVSPEDIGQQDLLGDTFFSLWKKDPKSLDSAPPERAVNKALIDWIQSQESWQGAHDACKGRLAESVASAPVMWYSLIQDENVKNALDKQRGAEEAAEEAKRLINQAATAEDKGHTRQAAEDMMEGAADMARRAQAWAQAGMDDLEKTMKHPLKSQVVKQAIDKATEKAEEVTGVMRGWGIDPGEVETTNLDFVLQVASNSHMKKISALLGRLRGIAVRAIQDSKAASTGATSEVAYTKDLRRIFPTERLYLSDKMPVILRAKKVQALVSTGLMGWHPVESAVEGGSFIAMCDESGSMGNNGAASAKALALGLAMAVREELDPETTYELYGFSDASYGHPKVTADSDWRSHIEWATTAAMGGTDFTSAFHLALKRLRAVKDAGFGAADFVFISDGLAHLDEQTINAWETLAEETGSRLYYLRIGGWRWSYDQVEKLASMTLDIGDASDLSERIEDLCEMIAGKITESRLK
jgi:uncharacterized protein with von Willebrand factor type A (vWA) domain